MLHEILARGRFTRQIIKTHNIKRIEAREMASAGRTIYNFTYWAAVGGGLYLMREHLEHWYVLLQNEIGPYAGVTFFAGGIALIFGLIYLQVAIQSTVVAIYSRFKHGPAVDPESLGRNEAVLRRLAVKHIKKGEFAQAAEIYESLESWEEAAESFEKAGLLGRAAQAWIRAGNRLKAIPLFEQEKQYALAADAAIKEGLRDRANKNYRLAGEAAYAENSYTKAAQYFEKAQDYERAGRIFESLKRIEDALRCYERAGAADRIEKLVQELDTNALLARGDACLELVRRAAEQLARQDKPGQGAELLEKAGDFIRAAEMYESAEMWDKAGNAYFQAELYDRAEQCYLKIAERAKQAELLARVAIQRSDWQTAGDYFLEADKLTQAVDAFKRAKNYLAAAKVYEQQNRFLMAAEMYAAAKEIRLAAEAYAKAHDWRNAAECFEAAGDLPQAVQAYVSAGDYYRAGKLALQLNDLSQAVDYLQRVPPTSPDWKLATGFLGAAFYRQGRGDLARDMFQRVANSVVPTAETLPILYAYARQLEEEGDPDAVAIYRRILAVDVKYEDVQQRLPGAERLLAEASRREASQARESGIGFAPFESSGTGYPTIGTRTPTQTSFSFRRPITQVPETRFGEESRYQILSELGRGGMAIVYRAFDTHLEREVALKTFPLSRHAGPGREDVFLREARLIARLSHPNIVTIYDCGHMNYLYYIAMEYVPGENLKQIVKRKGPLSLEELRSVIAQLADALMYAHSQQVLHRDIKPANVIKRESGDIKVVDFGVAKILSDAATCAIAEEDSQRTLVGTPQYMAPEQILGQPVDARTDIYALGLTIFYLVTGRTPFDVKKVTDPVEISQMQVHSSFPLPSTINATLPPKLDEIFVRCTRKNPNDRYSSVREFLDEFMQV
ncbi:MAG: hypothetical protein D6691_05910 [Candidatus Hydrogenedentota bacterium]|uniref:Serine/threonine protein kinase PrkC, regulator of stationary phase n=1 Tax=Sumerlaea chitinivorans TaxID=2250252 RepID=A0A2Z4Y370_SUMC1|nr:Serine/threonine protein kinase PrkC, regulator of stationary phase [Candidatus Sumerlaea chitinivorans]RMH27583.1 MAG: hypothetical protein D6691_05910 [Candidatus Hydrogenedentota bacterium]